MRAAARRVPWLHVGLPLVAFAALACLRMPQILIKGRFWAEEGTVFFHNAWVLPPAQALFTSFGGYLNLAANAAPLAARWLLPLPLAPYLTIATGLAVQLCPPLLLLTARDAWLRPSPVRAAGLLLMLFVPASEEVWLQALHCQFQLLLCCGIILALDTAGGWRAGLRFGLLFLAPLCGPVAIALLPLFLLRAAMDRSLVRLVQAGVLGAAACIQLLLFFHIVPGRSTALDPLVLLCAVTLRHLELPFLGVSHANLVAGLIRARRAAGFVPLRATFLPILVAAGFIALSLWRRASRPALWLFAAGAVAATASYSGAIGGAVTLVSDMHGGGRYVFAPQVMFNLALLALATTASRWISASCWIAVVWLLSVGAYDYVQPWPLVSDGPPWRQQVALWRADAGHVLVLWPEGWTLTLGGRR